MARILYGVAGEGSGHSSRAKIIIEHLEEQGHEVVVVSHDKGYENLKENFNVVKISGWRLSYKNNTLKYFSTLFKNILKAPKVEQSLNLILKMIKKFKPEIIFSDFEPLSALAASLHKIPLISIDNQHQLTNTKLNYPSKYKQGATIARSFTRFMVFNTDAYLITSFFETPVTKKKTFLFPPILRQEVLNGKSTEGEYFLVYVNSIFENLIPILQNLDAKFVIYGYNKNEKNKNLIFKKPSHDDFLKDLENCRGVVATAGLTLICEALYLGKPYLAMPVKKQFEQVLNAYYVAKLGYGSFMEEISEQGIKNFFSNLPQYRRNLAKYKREDNAKIFKKIDELVAQFS